MLPGFGFSVGDFVAAAGLIKKVSDALKDAGGASSEYQHVIIELEGLDRALKVVAALQPDHSNDSHVNAIRGIALSCQLPLHQFLFKIQKYEEYLGAIPSGRSISRNARKAKWAVFIADQVQSLRAVIAAKVVSINLLLNVQISGAVSKIEPAIREERNHLMSEIFRVRQSISEIRLDSQKAQSDAKQAVDSAQKAATSHAEALVSLDNKVDGATRQVIDSLDTLSSSARSVETSVMSLRDTGQQILRFMQSFPCEIRDLLQKILRVNLQLYWMLTKIQSNLTKSPTTLLESNILFEDAMGRVQSLPYEWFRHWETFEGLLKVDFKNIPGESKVLDGSYHLSDNSNRGQLICKENWAHTVIPGSTILMSMIMTELRWRRGLCPRPSCQKVTSSSVTSNSTITCPDCGLKYSIIRDSIPEERKILKIEDEETYISQMQVEEDIRVFGDRPSPLDLEETDNSVTVIGDLVSAPLSLTRLPFPNHLSYGMDSVEPMDVDDVEKIKVTQNNSRSSDNFTAKNEILDSPQAKKLTPLDVWLSRIPVVDTASFTTRSVPASDLEDREAKGIENFRNVHINDQEGIGQIQTDVPEKACTDSHQEIEFSARIFYRNIRDRYPYLSQRLARRFAEANKSRSDRLGLSRIEQGGSSSSDDLEDKVSCDSVLDAKKVELEGNSINNASQDAKLILSKLGERWKLAQGKRQGQEEDAADRQRFPKKRKIDTDTSYWSGIPRVPSRHSTASRSSTMNSSLHGSNEGSHKGGPVPLQGPRSFSTGKSSRSGPINDHREPLLALPPPPIELGTQQSFACDICGCTVNVLRRRDWKKHVFQDLEPYMCTYEDCPIAHKTYATRRAFITHEIRHHREVARKFGCNFCGKGFDRKRDAKKHIHFDKCRWSTKLDSLSNPKGRYSKRGFHITEERVANSVCPFCAKEITGGCGNLTQHLGKHLEEVSFAVVRKPYEEWQFYEDSVSAKSPVPSVVLNEDICKSTVRGDVKMVMNLLIEGADVNTEIDGKSLLHVASAKGHYAMVWLLLQKGADHQKKSRPMVVNNPSFSSMHRLGMLDSGEKAQTALEVASINGHIEVAALLAKVASDQGFQTTSENALLLAAEFGQLSIVEELVRCFETVGDDCLPASLHFAAKNGYIDIVRFLLPHATKTVQSTCLNPALSKWYNYTDTLHAALKGGHKAIALLLLEHGHRISESTWYECGLSGDRNLFSAMLTHEPKSCMLSDSALVGAIERGHTEFVKMLLDNGNKATSDAITRASRLGHSTILSLLLDQGAVPEASDLRQAIGNGHTDTIELLVLRHPELLPAVQFQSISLALSSGSAKTVEKVLQLVQELPYPNHFELENGALYDAAAKGHGEIVRLLILKGFDVNAEGDFRENPLHRACEGGHHEVVELLLGAGAAVNGTNGSKLRTPLAYARTQAVYDMLVERGGVKYIYKDSSWVIEDEFNNEYY